MVSFFERGGRFVRCETYERADGRYELIIIEPDGAQRVEVFDHSGGLDDRLAQVEHDYLVAGWGGPHGMRL
jgi:hypothetical protein